MPPGLLAVRLAAFDGIVEVSSPPGGPTAVSARVTCGKGADPAHYVARLAARKAVVVSTPSFLTLMDAHDSTRREGCHGNGS